MRKSNLNINSMLSLRPSLLSAYKQIKENNELLTVYYIAIGVVIIASIFIPTFRTIYNITNVLVQSIGLGIVSIGQTFVMLSGGYDLSVGSIIGLTSCLTSGIIQGRLGALIPVLFFVLLVGIAIGAVNGILISKLKLAPFIATFAMMGMTRGIIYMYTKKPVGGIPAELSFFAQGFIGPIPFSVIIFLGMLIISSIILKRKTFGRYLYAVGGNQEYARLSGINTHNIIIITYIISGLFAAVSGIFLTSRMGIGDTHLGEGYELNSITAVFLGGSMGGRGSVISTYGGVLIVSVIANVLNLLNVSSFWQMVVKGIILLSVVIIRIKSK